VIENPPPVDHLTAIIIVCFSVSLIGVSKAGFGGGLGMLSTPVSVLALTSMGHSPEFALGFLLPLLIAGDAFSALHYRGKWELKNLKVLLPGIVAGVLIGSQLIGRFPPRQLNMVIGLLAVGFVVFQFVKEAILKLEGTLKPGFGNGSLFGFAAGVTSSFAHGAGPVMSMYLIPQKMPKEIHVATRVLIFTCINWIKAPFFVAAGVIHSETLLASAKFVALVPVGVAVGVWLNRRFSEEGFMKAVYVLTFLAGLQLIFDFRPTDWFR
jgi:uncharacterized membrane protein YfcA